MVDFHHLVHDLPFIAHSGHAYVDMVLVMLLPLVLKHLLPRIVEWIQRAWCEFWHPYKKPSRKFKTYERTIVQKTSNNCEYEFVQFS